jgi:hypothetical protein
MQSRHAHYLYNPVRSFIVAGMTKAPGLRSNVNGKSAPIIVPPPKTQLCQLTAKVQKNSNGKLQILQHNSSADRSAHQAGTAGCCGGGLPTTRQRPCQVHHKNTDMLGSPFLAPCLAAARG